jgi:hypothetical protein
MKPEATELRFVFNNTIQISENSKTTSGQNNLTLHREEKLFEIT